MQESCLWNVCTVHSPLKLLAGICYIQLPFQLREYSFHAFPPPEYQLPYRLQPVRPTVGTLKCHETYILSWHVLCQDFANIALVPKYYQTRLPSTKSRSPSLSSMEAGVPSNAVIYPPGWPWHEPYSQNRFSSWTSTFHSPLQCHGKCGSSRFFQTCRRRGEIVHDEESAARHHECGGKLLPQQFRRLE